MTSSKAQSPGAAPIEARQRPPPDSVLVASAPSAEIMFSNWYADRLIGRRVSDVADGFPLFHLDGRPYSPAERQVERSIASGEVIVDEEFFGPGDEESRHRYRCSCWPVYDDGGEIVAAVAITRDITEQKRQDERVITDRKAAREELIRRAEQQALVAALGLRALAGDDLQSLLDEAVGLVARTLDVELAGVAELAPPGEEIVFRAGAGWREGFVGQRFEREDRGSLTGYTLRSRAPVIVDDIATDPRLTDGGIALTHGAVSALSVMIESQDEPFGVLLALSTHRRAFSPSDVSFVQAVANVLASAVESSRTQVRIDEVRAAERRRLARDLHDDALQELTEALAEASLGRSAGLQPAATERLVSTLKRVAQQLRAAIYDLRLTEEESRPFPEALRTLVDVQRAMAVDYEIELDIDDEAALGLTARRCTEVLRIVGEALNNVRRHSGARRVRVTARAWNGGIVVEVTDDGRGFDPDEPPSRDGGLGIQGMHERAALLNGDVDIRSAPGAGTTVRIALGPAQRR